jgi:hypothetical protein
MPTLSKAQLIQPESPWGAAFDRTYLELCRDRAAILTPLGFYAEHDLPPPRENSNTIPTQDEETELRQIASALTVAAAASEAMPTGVLVATLLKVSKNPNLFFARELPQPVEWAIANDYRRGDEPPGTHWRDVWGDQVAKLPGEVEQPTEPNIAKAANAAIAKIRGSGRLAALTIRPIKFLQTNWARSFASAGSRSAEATSGSCAGASWSSSKAVRSMIFSISF